MAIFVDSEIQIAIRQRHTAQLIENVFSYNVAEAPAGVGVSAEAIGEAWWNHIKTTWRACVPTSFGAFQSSVFVRVINNPAGDYGEYAIPAGEQTGTRSATASEALPPFTAAGVRMSVATRTTRPGQKRFAFLAEQDNANGQLQSSISTPLGALMNVLCGVMTLGAPAALFVLQPKVFKLAPGDVILAGQDVTGYVINPYITSQTSRKVGHGL